MTDSEPPAPMSSEILEARFARTVAVMRNDRDMSQGELAELMRKRGHTFHQTTVNKIEDGKRKVSVAEAIDLAAIFDVPLDMMLRESLGPAWTRLRTLLLTMGQLGEVVGRIGVLASIAVGNQDTMAEVIEGLEADIREDPHVFDDIESFESLLADAKKMAANRNWRSLVESGIPRSTEGYDFADIHEMNTERELDRQRRANMRGVDGQR